VGRHLLLTGFAGLLALALTGCGDERAADVTLSASATAAHAPAFAGEGTLMTDGAHARLACARCHDGAAIARAVPAASADGCLDCHRDEETRRVSLGTITMDHYDHGDGEGVAAGCAACHTHSSGRFELAVTTTGCALCHAANLDGSSAEGCRLCHTDPAHVALTSQNVPVVHTAMPWIGGECVRCHFDVGRPATTVAASACVACHRDAAAATEQGAGRDLHPLHTDVSCSGCHENVSHRIVAMSSGVRLNCTQCHATVHDIPPGSEFEPATCNGCHVDEHAAEQRLMLGAAPAGLTATPSDKFLVGLTCRSCHLQTADGSATRTSCVDCHSAEYATVLRWWERGSLDRIARTASYIDAARSAVAATNTDGARDHLAAADSLLGFIRTGGYAHNLPLTHRALEESVARASAAYTAAGRTPAARPDLGRTPRMGQCTYCHYEWTEPRFQLDMPDAFHRQAMSRGERAAQSIGPP
jgi:hypothetical protein